MTSQPFESASPTGPVTEAEFKALVRNARIQPAALALSEGLTEKQLCDATEPLTANRASSPKIAGAARPEKNPTDKVTEAVCEECRKIFPMKEMTRFKEVWICAACKPGYFQRLGLGTSNYAGLMIRCLAKVLDAVIIGLCFLMPFVLHAIWANRDGDSSRFETLPQFLFFGYHMAYVFYSIFFIGRFGATPGKMLCKLKVVTADGDRVGYGRAIGRFFAELASEALLFSGYIMAAFHEKRLALHDRLCNTVVLYNEKATVPAAEFGAQLHGIAKAEHVQTA